MVFFIDTYLFWGSDEKGWRLHLLVWLPQPSTHLPPKKTKPWTCQWCCYKGSKGCTVCHWGGNEVLKGFVHGSINILRLCRERTVRSLAGTPTLAKHPPIPDKIPMGLTMKLIPGFQGLHCMPLGWHSSPECLCPWLHPHFEVLKRKDCDITIYRMPTSAKHSPGPSKFPVGIPMKLFQGFQGFQGFHLCPWGGIEVLNVLYMAPSIFQGPEE
jgi:hypothetical protein